MATIRIPERIWIATCSHLFIEPGEHFAFYLAGWTYSCEEPVFTARDVLLIPDTELIIGRDGVDLKLEGILTAINAAVKSGDCLIEIHNHGGNMPRFSPTDRSGLKEFSRYVHESLPDRPYAATVWGDSTVYGEYFLFDGRAGQIDSITVTGERLRQIVSRNDDRDALSLSFDRQLPWFTLEGQRQLGCFRVGVVGCGGTGSQIIQSLAYLGCRDFVLVDNDEADETSMNRLVTAVAADIGTPKVILGRRLLKSIAPATRVLALNTALQSWEALDAIKGVDIIFGCVDNDGARLVLNEVALAYNIPYIDLAVGIEARSGTVSVAGGRVAVVLPGGPCLHCMGEIDPSEAGYFLAMPSEQRERLNRGYIMGVDVKAPSVVSLNAGIAAIAVNEFINLISGLREVSRHSEYDLLGLGRSIKSQWLVPTHFTVNPSCPQCSIAGRGDRANVDRYIRGIC